VLYCGATPVFADIHSLTEPNISPSAIARALSPRTRAVIVVHYAGYSCRMAEIKSVLAEYMQKTGRKIWLIEDAAHSIGGKTSNDEWLGCAGDIGCFSFFSNKNLATGEGGLILTNNAELGRRLRLLRSHSMTRTTLEHHQLGLTDYDVTDLGYNYRPTEITAALAKVQFSKLENNNQRRQQITAYYHKLLKGIRDITLPFAEINAPGQSACHLMPILLNNAETVNLVRRHLHQQRIQTSHHYRPIVDFSYYRQLFGDQSAKVPLTVEYSKRELTLPLHPKLTFNDVEFIVNEIKTALEQNQ
ncbi:MAG: DegT/DnrJ/EryC1/StrS aminotransferase family protein, partial [Candidatus Sumerlaeia bacterium]|nr:DegT/DnrJ/EryC1/StrS aminotransferase family protein [Candidatus Sumerlaeia bacterium]